MTTPCRGCAENNDPLKLVREGSVVEGKAFDLRIAEDNATVSGRVHATFLPSKRR